MPALFQDLYRFREFAPGESSFVKGRTPYNVAQAIYGARKKYPELRSWMFRCRSTYTGVIIQRVQ